MACWKYCAVSWTRCWATAARPTCSTWSPVWSRCRTAGAMARCIRSHAGSVGEVHVFGETRGTFPFPPFVKSPVPPFSKGGRRGDFGKGGLYIQNRICLTLDSPYLLDYKSYFNSSGGR